MLTTFSLASFSAAAKSLQSCPTLCDPHRQQPTRLPHPWDSPGKKTGVGCHFLLRAHSLCCSIIGLSFSVFHIQTLHKKIGLGEFFPLQERIYLLTKFYSQVASQKSIQPEYERRTVAQGQKVMTAVQGSSCVRLCLQKGQGHGQQSEPWGLARKIPVCQLHKRSLMSVTIAAGLENPK